MLALKKKELFIILFFYSSRRFSITKQPRSSSVKIWIRSHCTLRTGGICVLLCRDEFPNSLISCFLLWLAKAPCWVCLDKCVEQTLALSLSTRHTGFCKYLPHFSLKSYHTKTLKYLGQLPFHYMDSPTESFMSLPGMLYLASKVIISVCLILLHF